MGIYPPTKGTMDIKREQCPLSFAQNSELKRTVMYNAGEWSASQHGALLCHASMGGEAQHYQIHDGKGVQRELEEEPRIPQLHQGPQPVDRRKPLPLFLGKRRDK